MGEEIGAKVGDHPLAERHHQIVSRSGGEREDRDDADHRQEISADEAGVGVREPEVDHAANRDRHDERRGGSDDERHQRERDAPAMGEGVGRERLQRGEGDARPFAAGVGG